MRGQLNKEGMRAYYSIYILLIVLELKIYINVHMYIHSISKEPFKSTQVISDIKQK